MLNAMIAPRNKKEKNPGDSVYGISIAAKANLPYKRKRIRSGAFPED